jgi:hypothetical protein
MAMPGATRREIAQLQYFTRGSAVPGAIRGETPLPRVRPVVAGVLRKRDFQEQGTICTHATRRKYIRYRP